METLLKDNAFLPIHFKIKELEGENYFVIGKNGRFEKGCFTIYKISVDNNKITGEHFITSTKTKKDAISRIEDLLFSPNGIESFAKTLFVVTKCLSGVISNIETLTIIARRFELNYMHRSFFYIEKIESVKYFLSKRIDLFEYISDLEGDLKRVIDKYIEMDNDYDTCSNLVSELKTIGFTCEYGLDAFPYELHKI